MIPLLRGRRYPCSSKPGAQILAAATGVLVRLGAMARVMAKVLNRQSAKSIELVSLNPDHPNRSFELSEVDWMARIIWASQ